MRKGITPIISIIVLLLITVALAGAAWTYISGFMGAYTEKSFVVISGSMFCTNGNISMTIKNMGATTLTQSDFSVNNEIVNASGVVGSFTISDIAPKGTGTIWSKSGAGYASGSYTLRLGTTAGFQTYTVVC